MPEKIYKLQPNRTMHLRGFDDRGAAAAIHDATENSFRVSGVFRDAADFAVLMLYDADDFFGHPRLKYLPDFDFAGMRLEFDVHYAGLQCLDSDKYPWIDWPYLDVVRPDGTTERVRLFDHAEQVGGAYTAAIGTLWVTAANVEAGDRVRLWFLNYAFEYWASGGESADQVARELARMINAQDWQGGVAIEAEASANQLLVRAKKPGRDGNMIRLYTQASSPRLTLSPEVVQLSGGSSDATWRIRLDFSSLGLEQVRQMWLTFAPALADSGPYQATEWTATFTNWTVTGDNRELRVAGPGSVRVEESDPWCEYSGTGWGVEAGFYSRGFARRASQPGDAVEIAYHCQHQHDLYLGTSLGPDRGKWQVSLDGDPETELDCYLPDGPVVTRRLVRRGVPPGRHVVRVRLATGLAYFDFIEAAVPSDVPDPPAVWSNCCPATDWDTDHGYKLPPARLMWMLDKLGFRGPLNHYVGVFFWNQRVRVAGGVGKSVVQFTGRFEAGDQVFIKIGDQRVSKTVFQEDTLETIARHFAFAINAVQVGVWAEHSGPTLTIWSRAAGPQYVYPVSVEVERAGGSTGQASVESTDVSSAGIWMIDHTVRPKLNLAARAWHSDLFRECAARGREITVAYSMELLSPPDDPTGGQIWAARFASGVKVVTAIGFGTEGRALVRDATNTAPIRIKAPAHGYETGDLVTVYGVRGNTAANVSFCPIQVLDENWFALDGTQGNGEYVGGGEVVRNLRTTHCSFVERMLEYQKAVYRETAELMAQAGLRPRLQFGEFLWWFFSDGESMAYYDAETRAMAEAVLGRPLHVFRGPDDDPGVNGYADADFLRGRMVSHMRAIREHVREVYPDAEFELLLPLDVNYPRPVGRYQLGGQLNHYVNVAGQFTSPSTAPFDALKIEALDFGSGTRSTDLAREAIRWPWTRMEWPKHLVRYLVPLFNGGCPWQREYLDARDAGVAAVNLWAFDHLCLFGWPADEPEHSEQAWAV